MGFDYNEALTLLVGLVTSVVLVGAFISRFTKTPRDDEFFARLKSVLSFKSKE